MKRKLVSRILTLALCLGVVMGFFSPVRGNSTIISDTNSTDITPMGNTTNVIPAEGNSTIYTPGDNTTTVIPSDGNSTVATPSDGNSTGVTPSDGNSTVVTPSDGNSTVVTPSDGNSTVVTPGDDNSTEVPGGKESSVPQTISLSKGTLTVAGSFVYTGKALTPKVTVVCNQKTLTEGTDFTVAYKNNTNVGTASVAVAGKGRYTGTLSGTFRIVKAANNITVKPKSKTIKFKKLKKKKQSFTVKASAFEGAKVTFKKKSIPKNVKKYIAISSKGKIAVKKGLKKGKYKVKVKITAAATANYKKTTKTATIKILVK